MAAPRIPPIQCLQAFEAVARLRSVSAAAEELAVTPSAVSHRIRQLESQLGFKLFGRDFVLGDEGQAYLPSVRQGLAALQRIPGVDGVRPQAVRLRLAVTPTFSRQILLPRLALFRHANPEVELVMQVAIPLANMKSEDADLEIRFGTGDYPGLESRRVLTDELTPVCSPDYLHEHGPLEGFDNVADIRRAHLIRSPLAASGLSLIANTAPVAYGALGTPVITLAKVHGYDLMAVSGMIGRQLPFFSLLVPFWLIWAFAGRKAMWEIWPAILVTGLSFAIPQYLVSNFIGPELVDVIAAMCSMVALVGFLRVWQPRRIWTSVSLRGHEQDGGEAKPAVKPTVHPRAAVVRAWTPWVILTVFVFVWGLPATKAALNGVFAPKFTIDGLHKLVEKVAPVVPKPTAEAAEYVFGLLSATGTGILLAAVVGGLVMGYRFAGLLRCFGQTVWLVRMSLLTIVLMLALGTLTRFSGLDTTLGLAFANTGVLYPFFGTLMGWLGVAMTGSDTASNVLFGGMQKVAAEQLGLNPNLMGAANSAGGVMGKMIDAQSIVVASTATRWQNGEGPILRYVFFHSIALAALVGVFVTLQAYVPPFTLLVR